LLYEWKEIILPLLIKALIPSQGPTFMNSSNPNYLLEVPSPNTITVGVGVRVSPYQF
jgi:hypothetical protein